MVITTTKDLESTLRAELPVLAALLAKRATLAITNEADLVDRTLTAADRDVAATGLEMLGHKRRDVTVALDRLRQGTYGECQDCGETISAKRLHALPWAALCLVFTCISSRNVAE